MTAPPAGPIRITHCIGSMQRGGAEGQLAELIARLPPERFRQSLVLLQDGGPLLERVRAASCEVVELRYAMRYRKYDPRFYLAMGRALFLFIRHLRRFRPHIVHGWLYWANVLAVVAARLARVPVVITGRRNLGIYKDRGPQYQPIENFCNRFTTLILANSEAVRQAVLSREKTAGADIRVIHNGVDLARLVAADRAAARERFGWGDDEVVGLVLANMHGYKGHLDALQALDSVGRDHPEFRLVLAGREQGAGPALRQWTSGHGLESRVEFAGERGDVADLLAAADLLLHPSRQEGFPNAVLEAMGAGIPVVAYDLAACRESIADGETGLRVPCFDVAAFAGATRKLVADRNLRERMGRAGAEVIREKFPMERMVRRMDELYASLVADNTQGLV